MATALDIITDAHADIGVLSIGETLSAADASAGLRALNRLIDQWAAERLTIHAITRTTFTITASDGQYSVGSGGDVNVARPVFIDRVSFIDTSTDPDTEYPLRHLTDAEYAAITLKADTSTFPDGWYYNPTYPLGTLYLFSVPTSSTLEGAIYAPAAVSELAALTTAISLPPGYRRMLVKNLAVEIAPSYGKPADGALVRAAAEALAVVKRSNLRPVELQVEAGALGHGRTAYDIYADG